MLFRGAGCLDLFRHVLFCGIMGGQIEKGLYGFEYSWLRRGLHATMAKGHGSFLPKTFHTYRLRLSRRFALCLVVFFLC